MESEKIFNRKISDIVAEKIEEWIQSGKVKAGEKLPSVRELCDIFNVGRSAIRDAITTLKGKGLVDVKRGEGTFICTYDPSHLFDGLILLDQENVEKVFKVRKLLEVGIVETAAENRKSTHLRKMKEALDRLKSAQTIEGWKADYDFHLSIAEATQNEILVQLMQTISTVTQKAIMDCHRLILNDPQLSQSITEQHDIIYKSIETGNPSLARESMLNHLSYVESLFQKV